MKELLTVRAVLADAYGKAFVQQAVTNANGAVNATVVKKLAITTPSAALCNKHLAKIAAKYEVAWAPEVEPDADGVFPEVASSARARPAKQAISADVFPTTGGGGGGGQKMDTIPLAPPSFGDEEPFPEPPPNLGGGGSVGGRAAKQARPTQKKPTGGVSVMPNDIVMSVGDARPNGGFGGAAPSNNDDEDFDDL